VYLVLLAAWVAASFADLEGAPYLAALALFHIAAPSFVLALRAGLPERDDA
jgi:hypothetical protein